MSKIFLGAIVASLLVSAPAFAQNQVLMAQQSLQKGEMLKTQSGIYTLIMQHDGNLVRYFNNTPNFGGTRPTNYSSNTSNGQYLHMQQDGNAAIYTSSGTWAWNAGSGGNPTDLTYKLVLRETGAVEIWKGNTLHKALAGIDESGSPSSLPQQYPVKIPAGVGNTQCIQRFVGPAINAKIAIQLAINMGGSVGYCNSPY